MRWLAPGGAGAKTARERDADRRRALGSDDELGSIDAGQAR